MNYKCGDEKASSNEIYGNETVAGLPNLPCPGKVLLFLEISVFPYSKGEQGHIIIDYM